MSIFPRTTSVLAGVLAHAGGMKSPDGGPIYVETDLDRWIAEPVNTLTAAVFLAIALYWLWRLRGQYRRRLFLTVCLPVLMIGGMGGTIYHATRSSPVWLVMDWLPIVVLGFALSLYFWSRVLRRWWPALLIVPAVFGLQRLNFTYLPKHLAINLSYSLTAAVVLLPAVLVLRRYRWRNWGYLAGAVGCFVAAVSFRAADGSLASWLPGVGSHFLWHLLGAGAAQLSIVFVYHLPPRAAAAEADPAGPEPQMARAPAG
jgi:hemolysin III